MRQADADTIELRRTAQFKYRMQGYKRKRILELLAHEFGASLSQVDEDWKHRDAWIAKAAELTDIDTLIATIKATDEFVLQQFREVAREIDELLEKGKIDGDLDMDQDSPTITLLAFKERFGNALSKANKTYADNLAKLGIVREAPKEININELQHKIDWAKVLKGKTQAEAAELFDSLRRGRS